MKTKSIFFAIAGIALVSSAYAQDTPQGSHTVSVTIPSVVMVDIEGGNIALEFPTFMEAGSALAVNTNSNNETWLNYSFIKTLAAGVAKVQAKVSAVIPGFDLKVSIGTATSSSSGGTLGTAASGQLTLSATDQNVVTSIGSSYTGDGTNNGHNLTYQATRTTTNYSDLQASTSSAVTVTYTITGT